MRNLTEVELGERIEVLTRVFANLTLEDTNYLMRKINYDKQIYEFSEIGDVIINLNQDGYDIDMSLELLHDTYIIVDKTKSTDYRKFAIIEGINDDYDELIETYEFKSRIYDIIDMHHQDMIKWMVEHACIDLEKEEYELLFPSKREYTITFTIEGNADDVDELLYVVENTNLPLKRSSVKLEE